MDNDSSSQDDCAGRINEIQAIVSEIQYLLQVPPEVHTPEELSSLECEVEKMTKRLTGILVGQAIQTSLDSEEMREESLRFVGHLSHPMRHDGCVDVQIRTKSGHVVIVRTSYFRRKGKRRFKKRHRGIYPGLALLGIYDRCSPTLLAEVSLFVAALASLEEAQKILSGMGIKLNIKTIRAIAYRFSRTSRLVQQEAVVPVGDVSGRRVVVS